MKTEILYMLNQALIITALYATGLFLIRMIEDISIRWQTIRYSCTLTKNPKKSVNRRMWRVLLAFPTGLALWGIIGFGLLVLGIPFSKVTILLSYILIYALFGYFYFDTRRNFTPDMKRIKRFWISAIVVFVVALICSSGVMKVSVSNDSYYYYSLYPQTIAIEKTYLRSFDVFLTDVGQISAVIGTLPWLFGFEETFGIQLMLGANLVAVFGVSVFEMAYRHMPGKAEIGISKRKLTILTACLASLMLLVATPFYVMSRWVLANIYFMTYFFIAFVLIMKLGAGEYALGRRDRALLTLYMIMLAMLRMEGGMMAGLLILCACSLDISNRALLQNCTVPVLITEVIYYITVYIRLKADPLYSFLGLINVIVMLLFMVALIVYLSAIRGKKFPFIQKHYTWLLLIALVLGNGVICAVSPDRYIGNIRFFWLNILKKNGWGEFAIFAPISLILLPSGFDLKKKVEFPVLFTVGYVLFTIALCWARDGTLRVGIGDSGNRVLMQIVPFLLYTLIEMLIGKTDT